MNYEEKYKEIVGQIKKAYLYAQTDSTKAVLEEILPELAESEDEKMRKALISILKSDFEKDTTIYDISVGDIIAWLEKQSDKCLVNFDEAEQEKYDFVSGQYIECRASFNEFKEDNSYWLEYIGDDNYIGRSDNILNQKFHITPRQLFTLFTWQHSPKEDSNVNDETNAPTEYGKYVDECLNEASKHFFSNGEDAYSVADLFYAGVRCGKSWFEKQAEQKSDSFCKEHCKGYQETGKCFADGECKAKREAEQKSAWSEDDERMLHTIIADFKGFIRDNTSTLESHFNECIDWLKSIKNRVQPEQEWSEDDEIGLGDALWAIKQARTIAKDENDMGNLWYAEKWLKSLRPQNTWKPSDDEIEKASQEWDSKANFNPFYMTMDGDKPNGVKQDITTHKESFKAGVEWILKKIGF